MEKPATTKSDNTTPRVNTDKATGGATIGGFVSDPGAAAPGTDSSREGRGRRHPDDHDKNVNGAPIGPKVEGDRRRSRENPDVGAGDPRPAPNAENQPAEVRRRGQQNPDQGRRPKRYGRKALELIGRNVTLNLFDTTDEGENYLALQPAVITDVIDEEGHVVDLFALPTRRHPGGLRTDVQYAADVTSADDGTWSHVSRF